VCLGQGRALYTPTPGDSTQKPGEKHKFPGVFTYRSRPAPLSLIFPARECRSIARSSARTTGRRRRHRKCDRVLRLRHLRVLCSADRPDILSVGYAGHEPARLARDLRRGISHPAARRLRHRALCGSRRPKARDAAVVLADGHRGIICTKIISIALSHRIMTPGFGAGTIQNLLNIRSISRSKTGTVYHVNRFFAARPPHNGAYNHQDC